MDHSGYMMPAMSAGAELVLDELRQQLARPHAVFQPHVVVVQEHREQPHIVSRRLCLLVDRVSNLPRRIAADSGVVSDIDELERLNRLRLAVLGDLEVLGSQIVDGIPLLVGDDHIDADEVDVSAERRERFGGGRLFWLLLRRWRRLRLRRRRLWRCVLRPYSQREGRKKERRHHAVAKPEAGPHYLE